MAGKSIEEIAIGEKASFSKTITEGDVYLYAGIIGDLNPAHINEEAAKKGIFGKRIAHGMLTAGLVSTVLGMKLPGEGTIYGTGIEVYKACLFWRYYYSNCGSM